VLLRPDEDVFGGRAEARQVGNVEASGHVLARGRAKRASAFSSAEAELLAWFDFFADHASFLPDNSFSFDL